MLQQSSFIAYIVNQGTRYQVQYAALTLGRIVRAVVGLSLTLRFVVTLWQRFVLRAAGTEHHPHQAAQHAIYLMYWAAVHLTNEP